MIKYFLGLLILLLFGCSYNASDFETDSKVVISRESKYILIEPQENSKLTTVLFYPGALVEPESYISIFQQVALTGYPVIILKATADLAIFNINRASKVVADFPDVEHWVIGGHSLGGVVAIKAIVKDTATYNGLILFASYPAEKDNLSDWNGAVLSLSAENDSLTTRSDIANSKELLPASITINEDSDWPLESTFGNTLYCEIAGGNHAQFGDYGTQKNDGKALITIEEQHQQISDVVLKYLELNFL